MDNLRKILTWYLILNKRLLRKISFVLILCSIPIMALIVSLVSSYSSESLKIVLSSEDPSNEISAGIIDNLVSSSGLSSFSVCDDPDKAREMVLYGEADAAWIFVSDIDERIIAGVRGNTFDSQCVRVLERKDDVALKLSREKLAAALSEQIGFRVLTENFRKLVDPGTGDEELKEYYLSATGSGDIFDFIRPSGESFENSNEMFMLLPVRGMMAIAIVLCGLATAMFYLHDEDSGIFCRISRNAKPFFSAGYHLTGILDVAIVVLVSIFICGINVSFVNELVSMLVYCLAVTAFVIFIRQICGNSRILSVITPLIIIVLIVISPILFSLPMLLPIQILTPTYYYLLSISNPVYILFMALYTVLFGLADLIIFRIKSRI